MKMYLKHNPTPIHPPSHTHTPTPTENNNNAGVDVGYFGMLYSLSE